MKLFPSIMLFTGIMMIASAASASGDLQIRFIGNEAFEITDGNLVFYSDFPYQSGAFGYMDYDPGLVVKRKNAYCLITHRHADHFESSLQSRMACKVIGPEQVLAQVAAGDRILWENGKATVADAIITAYATPHSNVEHFSYRIDWNGRSLYLAGDSEDTSALLQQKKLDVLFITPWLLKSIPEKNLQTLADKIVIYHHMENEQISCSPCTIPRPGEVFVLKK